MSENQVNEKQLELINYIKQYIRRNKLNEGERLPSENTLASQFGVNRNVVRSSYAQLSAQGLVYSEKGRGFFVSAKNKPIIFEHENGMGFSEIMNQGTRSYVSSIVRHSTLLAGTYLSRLLQIEETDTVHSLKVLRSMDHIPFALCQSFLPGKLVPNFEEHLSGFTSVNKIIMEDYGFSHPICSQVNIEACAPTAEDIKYLDIPLQMPILKQNELFYVDEAGPIEYFCVRARGDRFRFKMSFSEKFEY